MKLKFTAGNNPPSLPPYISYEGQVDGRNLFTISASNNTFYKSVFEQELLNLGFINIIWDWD
jgi:hypothetical protein